MGFEFVLLLLTTLCVEFSSYLGQPPLIFWLLARPWLGLTRWDLYRACGSRIHPYDQRAEGGFLAPA